MKVKLLSYSELNKKGYIFHEYADRIVVFNGQGSWKSIPKESFEKEFFVTDCETVISKPEYDEFVDLFIPIED